MGKLRFIVVCSALLAACSSTPKADDASSKSNDQARSDTDDTPRETDGDKGGGDKAGGDKGDAANGKGDGASSGVKVNGVERTDNSVPDDYSLTERDCNDLGKKLAELWRTELRAQMSSKLSDKQREKAEQSIEDGATKKEDEQAASCRPLVGKNVDPGMLKCAFNAKTVDAFKKCME